MIAPVDTEKSGRVRAMFARIASRYDLLNRLMTFGRDRAWRRELISGLGPYPGGRLLDVGAGSGDLAFEAVRQFPGLTVVACDFTAEMLAVGKTRPGAERILWVLADAEALPFKRQSFDAAVSGFLLRNVTDMTHALAEQARILNTKGCLAALDTTPLESAWLRSPLRFYMHRVIPWLGALLAGDRLAYQYLPESTDAFLTAEALAGMMEHIGLRGVRFVKRMFGAIALHWAYKGEQFG